MYVSTRLRRGSRSGGVAFWPPDVMIGLNANGSGSRVRGFAAFRAGKAAEQLQLFLRSVVANSRGHAMRWTGSLHTDAPELAIAFGV